MYSYEAFGLGICSELSLPELSPRRSGPADLTVRFGAVARPGDRGGETFAQVSATELFYRWDEAASFLIRGGRDIVIDPLPTADERTIRLPLLGVVSALALHQRGYLVLHGSAVVVGNFAAAFIGGKGWGKSTLAASLCRAGYRLLSDDLIPILPDQLGEPMVYPTFPQLKLWPDVASEVLHDDPDTLPRVATGYEKRARTVPEVFSTDAFPLHDVFVLAEGREIRIRPLGHPDALVQVIGHSYPARFGAALLRGPGSGAHLRRCANVVRHVSVSSLERPRSLASLPAVVECVVSHQERG